MKKRLIILSDLWGYQEHSWMNVYVTILKDFFDIQVYDCCVLGKVDKDPYTEQYLHQQFIAHGIEQAVETLLKLEKKEVYVLGFSVGGTIAWKAVARGLQAEQLFLVSATRVRYETERLTTPTSAYFGADDVNKPSEDWLNKMVDQYALLPKEDHECYIKVENLKRICDAILKATI